MLEYGGQQERVNTQMPVSSMPRLIGPCESSLFSSFSPFTSTWASSGGMLLLGGLIAFSPLIEGGTTHLPNLVMRITLFAVMTVWLYRQMRLEAVTLYRVRLLQVLGIFFAWSVLSLWWTPYKNVSVQWLVTLLMYVGLFGIVLQGIRTIKQVQHVAVVFVTLGICEGLLGIVQYVWLGEPRAKGTFFNPNFFATYELSVLALSCSFAVFVRKHEIEVWQRYVLAVSIGVGGVAFVLAQSRGALAAFIVVAAFIGYLRFGKMSLVVLLLLLLAGGLVPNPLTQRITEVSRHDPYAYSRVDIWNSSLDRIVDRPLGSGLGMYKYTSFQYRFPQEHNIVRYGKRAESAHSEYLQMTVELGVIGFVIFLVGLIQWVQDARSVWHNQLSSVERGLLTGLMSVVVGILTHAAVDSLFHEPALVILLVICGGLVLTMKAALNPEGVTAWRVPFAYHPVRAMTIVGCGVLLLALTIQSAAGWLAFTQGEAETVAGHEQRALEWFERASLVDPATTVHHDNIARTSVRLFHQSKDLLWLIKAMEREAMAVALNPLDGRFPYRLGTIYGLLSDHKAFVGQRDTMREQAAHAYENAIKLDPFSPLSYVALGRIRAEQGRTQEALDLLNRATQMESNFLPARVLFAELSLQAGNRKAAQSEFDTIIAIKKQYERRTLSPLEREFLDVDPYPLGRALALGVNS